MKNLINRVIIKKKRKRLSAQRQAMTLRILNLYWIYTRFIPEKDEYYILLKSTSQVVLNHIGIRI